MRKLQFIAHHPKNHDASGNESRMAQEYVAALLFKQLSDYGFDAEYIDHKDKQVEVSIANQPLPLCVTCQQPDQEGHLVCEISAHPDENQDWFEKINAQSLIRQLAHAVESSLKADHHFTHFEWTK